MKRKLISFLLVLCLLLASSLTVSALDPIRRFTDEAGLITDSDQSHELEYRMLIISQNYQMEVAILTVNSLNGKTATAYADNYYDSHGYGWGNNHSGLLLLIAMDEREWAVSTCGNAIDAVTKDEIDYIFSDVSGYLSDGRYYEAFDTFLDSIESEYIYYIDEIVFDASDVIVILGISLLIGAIVGGIAILIMRSRMNTAKQQSGAGSYMVNNSYDLYRCQDIFLYSKTTKTRRSENSSGNRTHTSSSGRSHGGSSGRF